MSRPIWDSNLTCSLHNFIHVSRVKKVAVYNGLKNTEKKKKKKKTDKRKQCPITILFKVMDAMALNLNFPFALAISLVMLYQNLFCTLVALVDLFLFKIIYYVILRLFSYFFHSLQSHSHCLLVPTLLPWYLPLSSLLSI